MRQWHLPTELLCDQHLLGEHVESHMFLGSIQKGISVEGYIRTKLFIPVTLMLRHEMLATEMSKRNMCHKSPLDVKESPTKVQERLNRLQRYFHGWDMYYNLADLCNRCPKCKARINKADARGALHKAMEDYYHLNVLPYVRVLG